MDNNKKMDRRSFLKKAAVGAAAVSVSCVGLTYVGTIQPEIEQPQYTGEVMNTKKRILVTYATRAGSTAEVADFISKQLIEQGFSVDLQPVKQVNDLSGYQAVVMGSPIRMGKWVGEANQFLQNNNDVLSKMPTAAFTVCLPQIEDHQQAFDGYLTQIKAFHTPNEAAFFLGKMALEKLSFLDRFISKTLKAKEQDLRDWEKIGAWAQALPNTLALN
jgi:menaquinone-dependent protoporphyrinogen oxidase